MNSNCGIFNILCLESYVENMGKSDELQGCWIKCLATTSLPKEHLFSYRMIRSFHTVPFGYEIWSLKFYKKYVFFAKSLERTVQSLIFASRWRRQGDSLNPDSSTNSFAKNSLSLAVSYRYLKLFYIFFIWLVLILMKKSTQDHVSKGGILRPFLKSGGGDGFPLNFTWCRYATSTVNPSAFSTIVIDMAIF